MSDDEQDNQLEAPADSQPLSIDFALSVDHPRVQQLSAKILATEPGDNLPRPSFITLHFMPSFSVSGQAVLNDPTVAMVASERKQLQSALLYLFQSHNFSLACGLSGLSVRQMIQELMLFIPTDRIQLKRHLRASDYLACIHIEQHLNNPTSMPASFLQSLFDLTQASHSTILGLINL